MDKRTRQGFGLALLGVAIWLAAAAMSTAPAVGRHPTLGLVLQLVALAGAMVGFAGLVVAGVSLLRGRS